MDAANTTMPISSLPSLGALVNVQKAKKIGKPDSEGGIAYVKAIDVERGVMNVKYVLTRRMSFDVVQERVAYASLATKTRCTSNVDRKNAPSLLSPSHFYERQIHKQKNK